MSNLPSLNADQKQAVDKIYGFIVGPEKEFFLTGGPGVGKTFTTKELAENVLDVLANYETAMGKKARRRELVLTSTTNKAAAVLSEQTDMNAMTIHGFLGLTVKNDFKTGNTLLKRTNNWRVHSNKIVIVDEASMIEGALYNLLHEALDDSCKIIYVGDKNQLPPVKEKLSPAVRLAENTDLHYEITTPVRNAGSPALVDLCNRLRADIENDTPVSQITNWPEVPGVIDYFSGNDLQQFINKEYGPNGLYKADDKELLCRILSYTNKKVISYNEYIRQIRNLPPTPVVGEFLICNTHFNISRSVSFSVEEELLIKDVGDETEISVDDENYIKAIALKVDSSLVGSHVVNTPADINEYLQLRNYYKRLKRWNLFYKLEETFIDLRNRESSTVHKAQGSTYDTVIMDMSDIFTCRDPSQLKRMLYVGASRAKNRVILYDQGIRNNMRGIYR